VQKRIGVYRKIEKPLHSKGFCFGAGGGTRTHLALQKIVVGQSLFKCVLHFDLHKDYFNQFFEKTPLK
jgi:hypothetical protein